ncbi:parathyroid hormone/parathyroid hormone-related peptide receptor-like [Onthophagus taurus]|uniref:parathyroid hormone/parathyroid hormone-related peptide receptor-like n=1 Tax=Onthophagus taurus TaxID=166361 RepID=UPI000C208873|nr:parathyroid hormone/parathyroid hormone-related peptide receptor-like [Onthophagus taurus]
MIDFEAACLSQNISEFLTGGAFCDPVFDGFLCWPATKEGQLASQECPSAKSKKNATKFCTSSGYWKGTNYTQCWVYYDASSYAVEFSKNENESPDYKWWSIMKNISHIGYWCSLIVLVVSMLIFLTMRRLYCARNRLHMHLFASFILRTTMFLLKGFLFFENVAFYSDIIYIPGKGYFIRDQFNWVCKLFISIWNYSILANYMLILMEGVYLHNLMYSKLFSDNNRITFYYCFGWGVPFIFLIPWVILRAQLDNLMCWTMSTNSTISMLVQKPLEIAVIINFILFIMIVKVLCTKVNSMNLQQRKNKYSRLIRSTLTLLLLFGVPYVIFIVVYFCENETLLYIWLFYDQVFTAFQGFFVSLLYCLLNKEVQTEIKNKYEILKIKHKFPRRSRNSSHDDATRESFESRIKNWFSSTEF